MANNKPPPKDRRSRPSVPPVAEPQAEPVTSGAEPESVLRVRRALQRDEQEAEAKLAQIFRHNDILEAERGRIVASTRLARASALAEKGRTFMFSSFGVAAIAFALALLFLGGAR